jgi:hypothetical protein
MVLRKAGPAKIIGGRAQPKQTTVEIALPEQQHAREATAVGMPNIERMSHRLGRQHRREPIGGGEIARQKR